MGGVEGVSGVCECGWVGRGEGGRVRLNDSSDCLADLSIGTQTNSPIGYPLDAANISCCICGLDCKTPIASGQRVIHLQK